MIHTASLTWGIAGLAALGVITRPFRWPEAVWAVAGSLLMLAFGLIGLDEVWRGVSRGTDVYLFLIGMMLLSELARREGLFDWLAAVATSHAKGSPKRLFALIYCVGILVTAFLSNDATAVVLTPAVYAAARAAKVKEPLPYLLICAFIANAASFILPISNPANLVDLRGRAHAAARPVAADLRRPIGGRRRRHLRASATGRSGACWRPRRWRGTSRRRIFPMGRGLPAAG